MCVRVCMCVRERERERERERNDQRMNRELFKLCFMHNTHNVITLGQESLDHVNRLFLFSKR